MKDLSIAQLGSKSYIKKEKLSKSHLEKGNGCSSQLLAEYNNIGVYTF